MSPMKALLWGGAVITLLGTGRDATANPFTGGNWVWANYGTGTDPDTLSNMLPGPVSLAQPDSGTSTEPVAASGSVVTNSGGVPAPFSASAGATTSPGTTSGGQTPTDAFVNFGSGPYPDAASLTSGGAAAWYLSPTVEHVFGGVPNSQQQADFTGQVLKDVQQTFALSGLSPLVTTDPGAAANHTLSVVANTSYSANPNAIGITNVGGNGFSFLDKLSPAQSVTDLEWALAHNIAHELMHAFGVATHPDQTGNYLDAAVASWSLLTNPNTTFSPAAVQDILSDNYGRNGSGGAPGTELLDGDLTILAQPVPEPATFALWACLMMAGVAARRRLRLRAAA